MMPVAILATKIIQKNWEMTETLPIGYLSESSRWELSNEYKHGLDRQGLDGFKKYLLPRVLCTKIAAALEGLMK